MNTSFTSLIHQHVFLRVTISFSIKTPIYYSSICYKVNIKLTLDPHPPKQLVGVMENGSPLTNLYKIH